MMTTLDTTSVFSIFELYQRLSCCGIEGKRGEKEKITAAGEYYPCRTAYREWAVQSLIVDQTHLVLVSDKLVLQKNSGLGLV